VNESARSVPMEPGLAASPPRGRLLRLLATPGGAFALALGGYMLFFSGHYVGGDNYQRICWAMAIIDRGSNDISACFGSGLHYAKYGIGGPLLHIPFILAARAITRLTGIACEGPVNMMLYELNAALGVMLVFAILAERCGRSRRAALVRALAIGFATVWFPYSKLEYTECLATSLLLATWLTAERWPVVAGLLGGYAIAVRTDAVLWLVPTALFATGDSKHRVKIAAAAVPGLALCLWSNWARTGSILDSGYERDFGNALLVGLYGQLFSAGKSLLLFSPLLLLYVPAGLSLWRGSQQRRLVAWSAVLLIGQLLLYAKWWDWSGDDSWGPRYLVLSTMAALVVVAASDWSATRWFAGLAALGVALQLPPALMGPATTIMYDHALKPVVLRDSGAPSPVTLDDLRFNPAYSQVTNTIELLLLRTLPGDRQWLQRTAWLGGFNPPLERRDLRFDVLWLRLGSEPSAHPQQP
jgi:hypothetical protein